MTYDGIIKGKVGDIHYNGMYVCSAIRYFSLTYKDWNACHMCSYGPITLKFQRAVTF